MKLNKLLFPLLAVTALTGCTSPAPSSSSESQSSETSTQVMKYKNPIIHADCPDPAAVRDGENVYLFGTAGRVYKINDFEYTKY